MTEQAANMIIRFSTLTTHQLAKVLLELPEAELNVTDEENPAIRWTKAFGTWHREGPNQQFKWDEYFQIGVLTQPAVTPLNTD